jgi:hypothetical protein
MDFKAEIARRLEDKTAIKWDQLFDEWLGSGLSKEDFLQNKGFSKIAAQEKSRSWARDVKKSTYYAAKASNKITDVIDDANELWQIVQGFRRNQALTDYKTAEAIRTHCKMMLQNATLKTVKDGREIFATSLRPSELRALAQTIELVQKVQRLALGMSTENIGIDGKLEIDNETDDQVPVFEVQVGQNGKFIAARPKAAY